MITWQEVADKSAILGSAPTEAGVVEYDFRFGQGGGFGTATYSFNWFDGISKTTAILDSSYAPILLSEVGDIFEGGLTATYGAGISLYIDGGSATSSWQAFTGTQGEGENPNLTPAGYFTSTTENTNWSTQSLVLNSYQLTTLTGQTGKTTTTSATQTTIPTTSLVDSVAVFTVSNQTITRTTTTNATTFTKESFTGSAYTATISTGQTTIAKFSSFSHNIPLIYTTNTATTMASGAKTYSFEEAFGYGETAPTLTATLATDSGSHQQTRTRATTASIVVLGSAGPSVVSGSSRIAASAYSAQKYTTTGQTFTYAATTSATQTFQTSTTLPFADVSGVVTFNSTSTHPAAAADFLSSYSLLETTGTGSVTGIFAINELHKFATVTKGSASIAEKIEVGIRVVSDGAAGTGVDQEGRKNNYSAHTSSVFLAATNRITSSNGRTSFSANSYTATNFSGGTNSGTYGVQGAGVTQWQNANGFLERATIVGGKLSGAAVILPGVYATYAATDSGFTTVTEPFATSWNTAAQTAWQQNSFSANSGTNAVQVLSRHPVTIVLDD